MRAHACPTPQQQYEFNSALTVACTAWWVAAALSSARRCELTGAALSGRWVRAAAILRPLHPCSRCIASSLNIFALASVICLWISLYSQSARRCELTSMRLCLGESYCIVFSDSILWGFLAPPVATAIALGCDKAVDDIPYKSTCSIDLCTACCSSLPTFRCRSLSSAREALCLLPCGIYD